MDPRHPQRKYRFLKAEIPHKIAEVCVFESFASLLVRAQDAFQFFSYRRVTEKSMKCSL